MKRNSDNRSKTEVAASLMTIHDAYAGANETQIFSNRDETNFVLSEADAPDVKVRESTQRCCHSLGTQTFRYFGVDIGHVHTIIFSSL